MSNSDDQLKKKKKIQSADDVAQAMAANMADPDFYDRHERIKDKAAAKVIAERKKRRQKADYLILMLLSSPFPFFFLL